MRLREAYGRKVVSTDEADTVGRVEAVVLDPLRRCVVSLHLAKTPGANSYLSWADVQGFGADAVTVASASLLRPPASEAEERGASKALQPLGKLVLDQLGTALGKVENVEFDELSGILISFDLGPGGTIASDRLLGLGSYAVVVLRAEPQETPAALR